MHDNGVASGDVTIRHQGRREQREPGGGEREPEPAHERVTERATDRGGFEWAEGRARRRRAVRCPAAEEIDACCDAGEAEPAPARLRARMFRVGSVELAVEPNRERHADRQQDDDPHRRLEQKPLERVDRQLGVRVDDADLTV